MRDDQLKRLQDLSDDLIEVVLEESDPKTWPGHGVPIADMTKDDRGDRYWCKKNAAATLTLAMRVQSLLDIDNRYSTHKKPGDDDIDEEVKAAEREAEKILGRINRQAESKRNTH